MLNKITKRIAAFACAAAVAGGCILSAPAEGYTLRAYASGGVSTTSGGYSTNNVADVDMSAPGWDNQDKRVYSYMYESSTGIVTRVENITISGEQGLVIEDYDMQTGALRSQKFIKFRDKLDSSFTSVVFGGFYAGKDYNFVVLGQENTKEQNIPVLCVLRFSKDFNSYKWNSLNGINTYKPFAAGSCRMTELNGKLYIHTCHQMYAADDGYNHQANMSFVVNEETLAFEQKHYNVSDDEKTGRVKDAFGYSSHSFDQFIAAEGNTIYAYDHGDAYPRSLRIHKYVIDSSNPSYGALTYSDLVTIPGEIGDNFTGVLTGSMELSTNNVLVGVKMIDMSNFSASNKVRDIYILVAPKNSIGGSNIATKVKLTSNSSGVYVSAPKMVKVNDDKFIVMWRESSSSGTSTKIATINGSGKLQGSIISTKDIDLSGCDPILCSDGKIRWYSTSNNSPKIVSQDPNDPSNFSGGSSSVTMRGDADGDGDIDREDIAMLQRYVTNWKVTMNAYGADVNGDGKINNQDIALLQQYLAGWKVKLG